MSSLSEAIVAKLTSITAITDVVGRRIVPGISPEQSTYPVIVYETQSSQQDHSLSGPTGPRIDVIELVVVGKSPDPATPAFAIVDDLCLAIKSALDGAGAYGEMWGTTEVQGCWFESEDDQCTTLGDDRGALFFIKSQTYTVAWK